MQIKNRGRSSIGVRDYASPTARSPGLVICEGVIGYIVGMIGVGSAEYERYQKRHGNADAY